MSKIPNNQLLNSFIYYTMEELTKIKKQHNLPPYLKEKRKIFNSKRYNTQPTQNNTTSNMAYRVCKLHCLTNRQSIQRNTFNLNNLSDIIETGSMINSKFKSTISKNYSYCDSDRFVYVSSIEKSKIKKEKVPNFWQSQIKTRNVKACKVDCFGYTKRKVRIKEHTQIYNKLFSDSSRMQINRQKLNKSIKIISRALINNYPRLRLECEEKNQSEKIKKKNIQRMLASNKQNLHYWNI